VFGGGGYWGGAGRMGGGPGMGGAGMGRRLRSALDAADQDDILGKVYDIRVIRRMPEYLAWVKKHLAVAATGTAMRTVANMALPYLVAVATNRFIITGNLSGLNIAVLVYVGFALLMWAGQYLETLFLSYSGQGILYRMRTKMFDHLLQLSMSFFDHNKTGKVMSRVQNDVDQLQTLLTQDIIYLAADIVTLVGIAVVMIIMDARLALITLSVVPVLVIVMVIWQKYARVAVIRVRQAIAVVNDNLQESISGVRVVQGMSREEVNSGQFDNVNKANLDANVAAARMQAFMMPTVQILTDSGFCLVLIFGGLQALAGQTTPGVLLAFLLYIQRFFAPVQDLTMLYTDLQRAMASGIRIFELIDVEPEIKDSPQAVEMPPAKGDISFQHVSFGYEPGADVLHDVDFNINAGETVAIVGPTGAGKSSLTSLITRFYEAQEGEVLIDGRQVASVTQHSLRRQIGIVPQDPFLFSGTIEDNIRYGRPDASHEEVIEAAKTAGVHDSIMRLERGYDTPVGERGSNLSGGQRQFVCLARTVLADPAILILDEATSNVDTNTERIMQESLGHIAEGRTCVIVAHRLSTVTDADHIIVFEHGRIVEAGSHQELMTKQGLYYQLFQTLSAPGLDQETVQTG
jgi:ABC-type multidrug transport system fused ATPase/permease subunit